MHFTVTAKTFYGFPSGSTQFGGNIAKCTVPPKPQQILHEENTVAGQAFHHFWEQGHFAFAYVF